MFTLTDWGGATHSTNVLHSFIKKWSIQNICLDVLDILNPSVNVKYDLVYSIEVLEHIQDDVRAAHNMHRLSNRYIFCLVPYATTLENSDVQLRKRAFERHGHYVYGYDEEMILDRFPNPALIQGCYWREYGFKFRELLESSSEGFIIKEFENLIKFARTDIINEIPTCIADAQGIFVLSHV